MCATWKRLNGAEINKPLYLKVEEIIQQQRKLGHQLKVCIGTDSVKRGISVQFATVIVFLRKKKGGFMLIRRKHEQMEMSIKERMIKEVAMSVEVAYELCSIFDKYDVEMEVHADINTDPHFRSNVALKEAMGYILGMGFQFKAKPDAFASSSCADKVI